MKRQVSELSEVAFDMGIRRIVALANNGHSNASLASAAERFGTLPIRLYWFDDGLYVVATETKHSDLLGGRLTHIGDFSIEETAQRLRNCVGGTDDFYRAYYAPGMLTIPDFLFEVGVAPDPHRVRIRVRKDSEPVIERILEAVPGRPAVRSSGALDPRVFDGEVKRWQTLHRVDYQRPLFLQEPDEPFRVIALPDLEALYLQFRANRNQPGRPIRAFLKQARDRIGQLKPTHLILDLRFNGGGDLTTTWRFMRELPELVPSRGRVFVITHQATFSAAIYSFAFAKAADPRRVISVGGHVGDREEFWAEAPGVFRLPNSGMGSPMLSRSMIWLQVVRIRQSVISLVSGCPTRLSESWLPTFRSPTLSRITGKATIRYCEGSSSGFEMRRPTEIADV